MTSTKYNITEEWLRQCYMVDLMKKEDIAAEAGCSKANIDRLLTKWGDQTRESADLRYPSLESWQKQKQRRTYEATL